MPSQLFYRRLLFSSSTLTGVQIDPWLLHSYLFSFGSFLDSRRDGPRLPGRFLPPPQRSSAPTASPQQRARSACSLGVSFLAVLNSYSSCVPLFLWVKDLPD